MDLLDTFGHLPPRCFGADRSMPPGTPVFVGTSHPIGAAD
ncbi:hypothetical protein Pd630_LPD04328 [Rhodococcus opacus PD630]|nr:hypothetical protein Pd630_LPD04328 [Rhodococcus opacus PD630]